jgi:tetratricopeptide (TPR) repeat protein
MIGCATMDEQLRQLLLRGREHYGNREYDVAEPLLEEVLRHSDSFADVHDMLGVIAHGNGHHVDAERHFERALVLNPNYTEAALNLAVTYNDRGKFEEARQIYARIKQRPTGDTTALDPFARGKLANMHADLAQAYADANLTREAVGELEKAVALCPDFADLRTKLGTMLRQSGDLARARAQYEAAVNAKPAYVPARIALGVTLLAMGDLDKAEEAWKQTLEIDPESRSAKVYLRMLASQRARQSGPPAGH